MSTTALLGRINVISRDRAKLRTGISVEANGSGLVFRLTSPEHVRLEVPYSGITGYDDLVRAVYLYVDKPQPQTIIFQHLSHNRALVRLLAEHGVAQQWSVASSLQSAGLAGVLAVITAVALAATAVAAISLAHLLRVDRNIVIALILLGIGIVFTSIRRQKSK
jgi:hypothetical protein